jgi:hypothetical protein
MAIASAMRSWYLVILFFPLLILIMRSFGSSRRFGRVSVAAVIAALCGIAIVGFNFIVQRFHADDLNQAISAANVISHSWGFGGSAVSEIPKFTSLGSMAAFAPYGVFTALFRPLPGEVMNGFGLIAGLENVFLIYLLYRFVYSSAWRKWFRTRMGTWMLSLIVAWSTIYCFISPQNLGSAVRFKLQILPVILVLVIIGRWDQEEAPCVE